MSSRIEILDNITTNLNGYTEKARKKDEHVAKAFERVAERIVEARNYLESGEDYTGQRCTSRMVGSYLLKTWRMTTSKDFNKLIVKKMPGDYRKLTVLFNEINKLAEEILAYDYKHVKAAEDQAQKVIPFLRSAEKGFRVAGERETVPDKSDFLASVSMEFLKLVTLVFSGKDENGALVSTKEIKEMTGEIWSSIEDIEWDEYITDDLHNPTFALKEVSNKFPQLMDPYMEKKFVPKKSKAKSNEEISEKMKEDAVHIEFDRSKRKAPLQKRGSLAAKKGALGAKKGGKIGKKVGKLGSKLGKKKLGKGVLERKARPKTPRDAPIHKHVEFPSTVMIPEEAGLAAKPAGIEVDSAEVPLQPVHSQAGVSSSSPVAQQPAPISRPVSPSSSQFKKPPLQATAGKQTLPDSTLTSPLANGPGGGLKKPSGKTWLTAETEKSEEPAASPIKESVPQRPVKPEIEAEPEIQRPETAAPPQESPSLHREPAAPQPFIPVKNEEEVDIKIVKKDDASLEDDFEDKPKKKGCLPFVIGASVFLILLIYVLLMIK